MALQDALETLEKAIKEVSQARRQVKKEILATSRPLVQQLAKCFNKGPCPEVRALDELSIADARGLYHSDFDPPQMQLKVRGFTIDVVLHEFAHHLQVVKHGEGTEEHGPEFFEALLLVANHYYGDPEIYDWEGERACPQTIKRFRESSEVPPLLEYLRQIDPKLFEDYAHKCEKSRVPCKLCNPEAKMRAAGAGR
jgi:hypothetical protein